MRHHTKGKVCLKAFLGSGPHWSAVPIFCPSSTPIFWGSRGLYALCGCQQEISRGKRVPPALLFSLIDPSVPQMVSAMFFFKKKDSLAIFKC